MPWPFGSCQCSGPQLFLGGFPKRWPKSGKARAKKLTPEERSKIARKAVMVRWAKAQKKNRKK